MPALVIDDLHVSYGAVHAVRGVSLSVEAGRISALVGDSGSGSGLPFEEPSRRHLLGTDDVGYDLLSELLWGTRVSLGVGVAAGMVAVVVGGLVGMLAGQRRGWLDAVLMRGVDLSLALPLVPLLIVLAAYLGQGRENEVLASACCSGPTRPGWCGRRSSRSASACT